VQLIRFCRSAGRRLLDLVARARSRKYAVEVDAGYIEEFRVPGAEICDSWENGDGSMVFVLRSQEDLRPVIANMEGIRGVSLM